MIAKIYLYIIIFCTKHLLLHCIIIDIINKLIFNFFDHFDCKSDCICFYLSRIKYAQVLEYS